MKEEKELKKDVYFLDNNCELKIVLTTIPHTQVFIENKNGKLTIKNKSKRESNVEK